MTLVDVILCSCIFDEVFSVNLVYPKIIAFGQEQPIFIFIAFIIINRSQERHDNKSFNLVLCKVIQHIKCTAFIEENLVCCIDIAAQLHQCGVVLSRVVICKEILLKRSVQEVIILTFFIHETGTVTYIK